MAVYTSAPDAHAEPLYWAAYMDSLDEAERKALTAELERLPCRSPAIFERRPLAETRSTLTARQATTADRWRTSVADPEETLALQIAKAAYGGQVIGRAFASVGS
jgi:hypothetical protein